MRTALVAAAVSLMAVAACGSSSTSPTSSPWGPLAVYESGPYFQTPGLVGTLELTDTCAFLRATDGTRYLVAWPLGPEFWQWDSEARQIVSTRSGAPVGYANGSVVHIGGGGGPAGASTDAMLAGIDWVAAPRPECEYPPIWVANGEFIE